MDEEEDDDDVSGLKKVCVSFEKGCEMWAENTIVKM